MKKDHQDEETKDFSRPGASDGIGTPTLNVGLDLAVLSPILFAMMVLMAVVTTIATTPILELLNPGKVFGPTGDQHTL